MEQIDTPRLIADQNAAQLFAQAPAPIAVYEGRELRYSFANDAYLKIFSYRDIIGKTVREAFPELEGQGFYDILEKVYETGQPFKAQAIPAVVDVFNNGRPTTRYYNLVYTPYRSPEGVVEGVMAFGYDVTEQITESKYFLDELARQVEERTRELQRANERLKRSNEELEEFAYIASHDLQEPLRKIQIFNSIMAHHPEMPSSMLGYLARSDEAAKRSVGLIRELLDYSRLSDKSAGFCTTNLNEILKSLLVDYELLIQQKGATIEADDLPEIEAVPLLIGRLFHNIIGNALKYSRKNTPPVITIKSSILTEGAMQDFPELPRDQQYIRLTFADNGIGFAPEYAKKIFTIFKRLNEGSTSTGYGIGLALCRKIVDTHNGTIYAEGHPDEGATFSVILPTRKSNRSQLES
jgi:signal transduction histidine kinase